MSISSVAEYFNQMDPNLLLGIAAMSGMTYMFVGVVRSILSSVTGLIKRVSFYNMEIFYANSDYNKFTKWIREHQSSFHFVRDYKVSSVEGPSHTIYGDLPGGFKGRDQSNAIVPGYGSSLLRVKGYPLMIFNRSTEKDKKNITDQADILKFKMLTLNKSKIHKFYNEVVEAYGDKTYPELKVSSGDWWTTMGPITKSSPPVSQSGLDLINDIGEFLASEDWYNERALAFKRGYAIHGCPGSGKSQLVKYAAVFFNMNLYVLNLREDIKNLGELLSNIEPNSIILVEDIDLTGISRRDLGKGPPKSIESTMSEEIGKSALHTLLNALSGVNSYDGSIFICTTNDIDALDPALLRKGRIDVSVEVDVLNVNEQIAYFNKFYGVEYSASEFAVERSIADLQSVCVDYKHDVDSASKILGFTP